MLGFHSLFYLFYDGTKAVVINEFEGRTFTCDLAVTSMCELTGDEVLQRLSFEESKQESVLGLGIVFFFFLISAFVVLDQQYATYTPLGHIGKAFAREILRMPEPVGFVSFAAGGKMQKMEIEGKQ